MANQKISDLQPALPLNDGDMIPVVQGSDLEPVELTTNRTTIGEIKSAFGEDFLPLDGSKYMTGPITFAEQDGNQGITWHTSDAQSEITCQDWTVKVKTTDNGDIILDSDRKVVIDASSDEVDAVKIIGDTIISDKLVVNDEVRINGSTHIDSTLTVNGDIIDQNLDALSVPFVNANQALQSSSVTPTELEYLSGVTSSIQNQINALSSSAGGSYYGSMSAADIDRAIDIVTVDTYVKITGGTGGNITGGLSNAFTFQNNGELKCNEAGKYLVNWSLSGKINNNSNRFCEAAVMINNIANAVGASYATLSPSGSARPAAMSGTAVYDLQVNDVVSLCIREKTYTDDINITHLSLTAMRVGA